MKRFMLGLLVALSMGAASCTTNHRIGTEGAPEVKQCSDTPKNAINIFLQGIKEFSLSLLRAVTPEGSSLYGIFGNNDEERGQEVIRQMAAHPINPKEGGSCVCSVLSMTDSDEPQTKVVVVKRVVMTADGDLEDYKRSFRVHFEGHGNCILHIDPVESKWERILG